MAKRAAVAGLVLLAALAGCGAPPTTASLTGLVHVLAPTSMAEVLPKLTFAFATAHPGVQFQVTYDGDAVNATRPGDVLLVEGPAVLAGQPSVRFARNQLVLAVAPANPARVSRLADLARPGLRVVRCDEAAPCGAATTTLLQAGHVTVAAPMVVGDVRAARALVEQGQADVALIYRTDVALGEDKVIGIEVPESSAAAASYQATALPKATNPVAAQAFVSYLTTAPAQDTLTAYAFQPA